MLIGEVLFSPSVCRIEKQDTGPARVLTREAVLASVVCGTEEQDKNSCQGSLLGGHICTGL